MELEPVPNKVVACKQTRQFAFSSFTAQQKQTLVDVALVVDVQLLRQSRVPTLTPPAPPSEGI